MASSNTQREDGPRSATLRLALERVHQREAELRAAQGRYHEARLDLVNEVREAFGITPDRHPCEEEDPLVCAVVPRRGNVAGTVVVIQVNGIDDPNQVTHKINQVLSIRYVEAVAEDDDE